MVEILKNKLALGIIVALAGTGLFLVAITTGLLSFTKEIPFEGTITTLNVEAYTDQQCTQACTSMSWGGVYAGESSQKTIYVKNTGNIPLTLSMSISDWIPQSANGPVSMTWNRENHSLDPQEVVSATLTLAISEDTGGISNFSYKMLLTGVE